MNLANRLSFLRIILALAFIPTILLSYRDVALYIFLTACLSDWLDGYIARARAQQTQLGQVLDPIADKVLVAAALLGLTVSGRLPIWIWWIIVTRDVLVLFIVPVVLLNERSIITENHPGRLATFGFMAAIVAIMVTPRNLDVNWIMIPALSLYFASGAFIIWKKLRLTLVKQQAR